MIPSEEGSDNGGRKRPGGVINWIGFPKIWRKTTHIPFHLLMRCYLNASLIDFFIYQTSFELLHCVFGIHANLD